MNQLPVRLDHDGTWWIGKPNAWHIAPVDERNKPHALAAALAGLGLTRRDLLFESKEIRELFDADFGS